MVHFTNKALARMCGYLAHLHEGRWYWYDAKHGKENCEVAGGFTTEREAYFDCVTKAGLK
jgi:hypothetical protein